ncbi:MAG: kelch repeat-containing protein [bacterium]|nr:kelch repeat-containing protein [bacterium]
MRTLLLLWLVSPILHAQLWVKLADFPSTKRDDGVAVVVNNTAYFGTGLQEWNATIDFYALNLSTRTWSPIAFMPHTTERQYACAFAGSNCFYVFGGDGIGGALTNMYKYTLASNSWTTVASKPGKGLIAAVCFPFGDKIIIAGGKFQDGTLSREVWEYTLSSDTWLQKNNFPSTPVWRASGTTLNGLGYMLFGIDSTNAHRKELYQYNPTNDTWLALINFPLTEGRAYAAMHGLNNRLFVFGGHDSQNNYYNDCWFFNPATLSWFPGPNLPGQSRKGGMSCANGQDFYYSCGISAVGRLTETWSTDVPTGIVQNKKMRSLSVFPNPCQSRLTISLPHPAQSIGYRINVKSILGEIVLTSNTETKDSFVELQTSDLVLGVYFVELYEGDRLLATQKFFRN